MSDETQNPQYVDDGTWTMTDQFWADRVQDAMEKQKRNQRITRYCMIAGSLIGTGVACWALTHWA